MFKSIVKKTLSSFGLEIRRKRELPIKGLGGIPFPIEICEEDRELLEYVFNNQLSMVSPERLWSTAMACRYVVDAGIPGDFVECGVWRGGNAIIAASIFKSSGDSRRVHLFDTFNGMTEPGGHDDAIGGANDPKKLFESMKRDHGSDWCYASLDDVRRNFEVLGLDNASFVEGDVIDTLADPQNLPERISVLRLDTDWYESTKKELEVLYPRLSLGGVLTIDDYGHWTGAKKAVDEYFSGSVSKPLLQFVDADGRAGIKVS